MLFLSFSSDAEVDVELVISHHIDYPWIDRPHPQKLQSIANSDNTCS